MEKKGLFILTNTFGGDSYRAAFVSHELSRFPSSGLGTIKEKQV